MTYKLVLMVGVFATSLLLTQSCQQGAPKEVSRHVQASLPIPSDYGIPEFMRETGVYELIHGDLDWNALHQHYLKTVGKFKDHPYLKNYKQLTINYLVKYEKMLEADDLSAPVLRFYLEELDALDYPYPETNYLMLTKMMQLDASIAATPEFLSLVQNAFMKGVRNKELHLSRTDLDDEVSLNNHRTNYEVYLPKLNSLASGVLNSY